MNNFQDALKNDSTKELIELLREDSERQAKNDQMFLQPMQSTIVNNNRTRKPSTSTNHTFSTSGFSGNEFRF